jgi:hypothetical protein
MARFSETTIKDAFDRRDGVNGLEQPRISVGAVLIGSMGVLNCASAIVTLIMAG